MERDHLGRYDTSFDPDIVLELAGDTDTDGAGVTAAVALDAALELGGPLLHPLAGIAFQVCLDTRIGQGIDTFHGASRIELLRVRAAAQADLREVAVAGIAKGDKPLSIDLVALYELHKSPLVAAPYGNSQTVHLRFFSQDSPGHLGKEPLGLQDERVDLRKSREDVGMDHIPEAFLQTQHAIGFLLLEDLFCFLFYLIKHLSSKS
jgi:hypothetical protein